MTLTFDIHKGSCTHLVDCIYQLDITDYEGCCLISASGFVTQKSAFPPESEH